MAKKSLADTILNLLGLGEETIRLGDWSKQSQAQQPLQQAVQVSKQVSQPIQQAQESSNMDMVKKAISVYGKNTPLNDYAQQMAQATQKYDFWKNNPELLALIPHLETSSGKNVTRPNNIANWGINYPGNNAQFAQMTPQEVFERFISGVAERSPYYKEFRTGKSLTPEELMKFAKIYEPANNDYGTNLVNGVNFIRQQIQ